MDGAIAVAVMFSTVVYCSDDFQPDRFIKWMGSGRLQRSWDHLDCRRAESKTTASIL